MTTKRGIIERHDFISDLLLEERIGTREDLLEILVKNSFFISKHTLEKDLKHLDIGYSAEKKCYIFKNEQDKKIVSEKKLRTILINAGLKSNSQYKIYLPMIFCIPYETPKIDSKSNEKLKHSLKLDRHCIYNVLITCKVGYEQSIFNVINEKFITNKFISAQINIGSVNFLFDKSNTARRFHKHLDSIIFPKK